MSRVMPPERWREVERVLDGALDLPPDARAAFLETACGSDAELRAEVERILRAQDNAGDFLEEPLPVAWPTLISESARAASGFAAPGTTIADRYVLERELGRGGMATVYLARDLKHHRPVAVKVLDVDLARSVGPARFLREIHITANLQHPHILPLHDSGEFEGRVYYVMPYVAGESLRNRLARERPLPVAEAIRLTRDVALALDYAHRRGIVHRDIKPGNILLEDGQAIVADFGIARAVSEAVGVASADQDRTTTRSGVAIGTPTYMSPEQALGEREITRQSDIYSLGCVLYEMLGGTPPFTAPTAEATVAKHLHEEPRPIRAVRPEVPPHVEQAVARALAKNPSDRFQSAGELADALGGGEGGLTASRSPSRLASTLGRRRVVLGGVALIGLAAVGVTLLRRRERLPVAAPAAAIAVFPLVPAVPDTALKRLGRELVVTLSASLEGVDGIRTVDALTVLATARASDNPPPLTDAIEVARRLGAQSVLYGSLVRVGDNARIDFVLHPTRGTEPLARLSVSASSEDVAALTDSAAWALLRQLWQRTDPPTPSLGAITTRSLPALRAFLDGERFVVGGRWRSAAEAFQRAFTIDSTFWFAYWRYANARQFYAVRVDSAIRSKYLAHRNEFPERDRLLIEAGMSDSLSTFYQRVKAITERFPGYWPAWWALSEYLAHTGPLFGTRDSDLRAALERTLALNPHLVSALDHLLWVSFWQRDTVLSGRLIRELTAVQYDSISSQESGGNLLGYYRYIDGLSRSGGVLRDTATAEAAIASLGSLTGPIDLHRFALGVAHYGFPQAQAQIRPLIARISPRAVSMVRLSRALAEAQRGAWASALATLDEIVATIPDPIWPLYRYRLAVVGAWLGTLDPSVATAPRAAIVAVRDQLQPANHAELAWLDGLLAVARNDAGALATARGSLAGTDSVTAPFLDRSLGAFALALDGRRSEAADSLGTLERERAEFGWSRRRSDSHPFLTAVNRLAAARWLAERGDPASAERLLTWHQAVLFPLRDTREANVPIEPFAYLEQARVAEALGRIDDARTFYQRFLWRYDLPADAHRHLVEEARTALVRLDRRGQGDRAR